MKLLLSFLLFVNMFVCCDMKNITGIPVPEDKMAYVGKWEGDSMHLYIEKDGRIDYNRQKGSAKSSIKGPIQTFEGNNFTVGTLGITTTFVVSKIPHEENGIWKMTVDGVTLTKIPD